MRGWLYSSEEPEGKVFEGEGYDAAVALGWVDSPALIGSETAPEPATKPKGKPGPKPKVRE